MNKNGILTLSFLIATSLSNLWAAPAPSSPAGNPTGVSDEPPPPPPLPEIATIDSASNFLKAAQRVEKNHTTFMGNLSKYLQAPNDASKRVLNASASQLGDSIAAVKRMLRRMEKDLEKDIASDAPAETQLMQEQVRKSKLPLKNQEDLMAELKKRLEQRRGDEDENGSPAEE